MLGSSVGRTQTVPTVQQPNWPGRLFFGLDAVSKEDC